MRILSIFLTIPLLLWSADTRTTAPPPATAHKRTAAPKNANAKPLPDAEIERVIKEKFARSKSAPEKFQVHVRGGVATIEGKTNVIQHKASATRMARTAGARQVVNRIEISDQARKKAASNLETGRRRAQVKRSDVAGR